MRFCTEVYFVRASLLSSMKTGVALALSLCTICLLCLILLTQTSEAQVRRPYVGVYICIYDFDAANQQVTFDFNATAYQVNLNSSSITGELDGPFNGRPFIMEPQYNLMQGVYEGGASGLQWPMYGRTQDYPFDSYETNFTFSINSYTYRNGTTGRAIDFSSPSVSFCGPKAISLANSWYVHSSAVSITRGGETSMGLEIQFQDNPASGWLLMVPISIAGMFLGVAFVLDSRKLSPRVVLFVGVLAFVSTYPQIVLTKAPAGSVLNLAELQLAFYAVAAAISLLVSCVVTRIKSFEKGAALEGLTIILLEASFVLVSLRLSFSWNVMEAIAFGLVPFASVGIFGIYWRVYTYTSRD